MWFGCSAPMQLGKISQMLEIEVVSLFRSPSVKSEKLSLTNEKTLFSKSIYSRYTRISLGFFTGKKRKVRELPCKRGFTQSLLLFSGQLPNAQDLGLSGQEV